MNEVSGRSTGNDPFRKVKPTVGLFGKSGLLEVGGETRVSPRKNFLDKGLLFLGLVNFQSTVSRANIRVMLTKYLVS